MHRGGVDVKASAPAKGCFVTGTDTGVGKTRIAAALIHGMASTGLRVAGFKPVAAGSSLQNGALFNDDVRQLREAGSGSSSVSEAEVGPCQFEAACAPQIAAALEGRTIERDSILKAAGALHDRHDFVVVEGVGGFRVPLAADWDTTRLAADLALPMVLVVGVRLGCINHALLTVEAIESRRLPLAGWIANIVEPDMTCLEQTIESLRHELAYGHALSCFGVVPWMHEPRSDAIAAHLDFPAIGRALGFP
jgi:dethiobiotin synthetase